MLAARVRTRTGLNLNTSIYTNTLLHVYLAKHSELRAAPGVQPRHHGHSASSRAACSKFLLQCVVGVPPHPRGHAELAGHAPLHPEKERILRVAPAQERGPTQHPTRESHRRREISTARANRNVVVRRTPWKSRWLRWRTRGAAMTTCTRTGKCKAFEYHAQTQIHAPGIAVANTGEYLAGQHH